MFNSSLRRVVRTCPNTALATRHNPTNGSIAIATFSTRGHQRRYSSSKPPVPPNNGSPTIPATSVKQVGAPRSTEKRPGAESRLSKRKAAKSEKPEIPKPSQEPKDNEWTLSLPSVPSTQHLNPKDVYVASFFSTHRPISISGPLPPEVNIDQFDKVFQAQSRKIKKNGSADVIYTLSNVVRNLDEHVQNQQQDSGVEQRAGLIKALTQHNSVVQGQNQGHHLDGQSQGIRAPGNVKMVIEEIAKRFRPFNTPPPPVPVPELDFQGQSEAVEVPAEMQAEANEELQAQQLEIEVESQDVTFHTQNQKAHTTPQAETNAQLGQFFTPRISNISEPSIDKVNITDPATQPQPSRGGRTKRGVYVDPSKSKGIKYYTISVKRQRKLKMKKHKYKKLMRKTRNLRRRMDKL